MVRPTVLAFLCALTAATGTAVEVELRSPLTTMVKMSAHSAAPDKTIAATIEVPAGAPPDLGVGVYLCDQHGQWYQRCSRERLVPGRNKFHMQIDAHAAPLAENHRGDWSGHAQTCAQIGLFFWSMSSNKAKIRIDDFTVTDLPERKPGRAALLDLDIGGIGDDGLAHGVTGERWTVTMLPQPFPINPYDSDTFQLEAQITGPDRKKLVVPGYFDQPMRSADRGDKEEVVPSARGRFTIRFRPSLPGRYEIRALARWKSANGRQEATAALPALVVSGKERDDFVRIDANDPRFFQVHGDFYWPIGLNLRSITDSRSTERLMTKPTVARGTIAYEDYLRRFKAQGGNATEIWLSSWNLALEWRREWPGYHGIGRYNEENAWRLDRILDLADELGIRVNLVMSNHGQASTKTDAEWHNNPLSKACGGKLSEPDEVFRNAWAAASQERVRRYVVARYADHPSLFGWKLWSEINLTAGERSEVIDWHTKATARWHELDIYGHGCTTHWSGSWRTADPTLGGISGLNYLCIDAYHQPVMEGGDLIAQLIFMSSTDRLGKLHKPILITEFGGDWKACSHDQLIAEHAIGPWAALVSGNAGAPMLWWFEWVDQHDHWQPYRAITEYIRGEDLRGTEGNPVVLSAVQPTGPRNAWWIRAWSRPGRILGYVLDSAWGANGIDKTPAQTLRIEVGTQISAGSITLEWWNADTGEMMDRMAINHPGGPLIVTAPKFERHVAFKLYR
jgi:hypothetical protein